MQKISFLLLGTSLSLVPQTLSAAECAVTDCSLLGYTDSACPGSGLKCPFGEGWYCGGGAAEDCIKLGYDKTCTGTGESGNGETCNGKYQSCTCSFPYTWNGDACSCPSTYKYTCSGTGYSGGSGSACNGKYTKCNCKSPYTWTSGACSCPSTYKYTCSGTGYSGGSGSACGGKYTACTCASGYEWNGSSCQSNPCAHQRDGAYGEIFCCNSTVVGVKASSTNFYVAMKDLGRMNWNSAMSQCPNYLFCGNLKGTLPTKDQLLTLYKNKSRVNSLLSTNGGTQLIENWYWSSTYAGSGTYYIVNMSLGYGNWVSVDSSGYVRPILTWW